MDEIRACKKKISRQPKFDMYMKSAIDKIVKENPKTVSINCHKGRHRSVGFAELLAVELRKLKYIVYLTHVDL